MPFRARQRLRGRVPELDAPALGTHCCSAVAGSWAATADVAPAGACAVLTSPCCSSGQWLLKPSVLKKLWIIPVEHERIACTASVSYTHLTLPSKRIV